MKLVMAIVLACIGTRATAEVCSEPIAWCTVWPTEDACPSGERGCAAEARAATEPHVALAWWRLACAAGEPWACANLTYLSSEATPDEQGLMRERYASLCDAGDGVSCGNAAFMWKGRPAAIDDAALATAAAFYRRGCELDDRQSCNASGIAAMHGSGRPVDKRQAMGDFDTACRAGLGMACYNVAVLLAQVPFDDFTPAMDRSSHEHVWRACELGYRPACSEVRAYAGEYPPWEDSRSKPSARL